MKVSVALCTCNGSSYLWAQLDSLIHQTRRPDELIVCDDASHDETVTVLRAFAKTAPFPVRICVNPVRLGIAANFTRAFQLCHGDVIFPCDQDDYWLPDKIDMLCRAFQDRSVGLVFSDAILADADLRPHSHQTAWSLLPFPSYQQRRMYGPIGARCLTRFNVVTGSASAFRRELCESILPIPDEWIPDAWIAFHALAVGRIRAIPTPTLLYRVHEDQQIGLSRRSLLRQLRSAYCGRTTEFYSRLATRYELLLQRLRLHHGPGSSIQNVVESKMKMAQTQAAMRGLNRVDRAAVAWELLLRGLYAQHDHGVRAFLVDLLGP